MEDYQGNSKKQKEIAAKPPIERITSGKVIVQKPSLGKRIKGAFIEADFKSVTTHAFLDVLLPAAKNMLFDLVVESAKMSMFGDRRRGGYSGSGSRYNYQNYQTPVSRPYSSTPTTARVAPTNTGPRGSGLRGDVIVATRDEAEGVLEMMREILDKYNEVSAAEFNQMVGVESTYVDERYGWTDLTGAHIRQMRDGWLIELPPVESI